MRKISSIIFVLALTMSLTGFAQKVKIQVKKEKISANKVEVAKIVEIDEDRLLYGIEDLTGTKILEVQVNNSGSSANLYTDNWITVSSPNFETVNVIDYEMTGLSRDHRNIIGSSLIKKYGLLTAKGFDQNKLEQFFKIQRISENKELRTGYGGPEMRGYAEGFRGKIKIKNGFLLFDKKEIAKIKEIDSSISYSSLNGGTELKVVYNNFLIEGEKQFKRFRWLEVSDDQGRSSGIKMEYLSDFGGDTKQITNLLARVYNLLSIDGIQNLDGFFAIDRPKLAEEYRLAEAENSKILNEGKEAIEKRRPLYKLSGDGDISKKENDEALGRIVLPKSLVMSKGSETIIQVGERDSKKVLELTPLESKVFVAEFFDKEYYYFKTNNTNLKDDSQKEELLSEILNFVIAKKRDSMIYLGYEEYRALRKEKAVERYKARKLVSPNIYGKPGYVIDDEGKKWEGEISMNFEELINPEKDDSAVFKNVVEVGSGDSKYGKEVQIEYLNEKGKTKKKIFKSSKGTEFRVNDGNTERLYKGFKTNVGGLDAAISAASLNFNYSSYYLILSEDDDITLYQNPVSLAKGIKTKTQDRGYNFIIGNSERNFEKLKKYLGDCKELPISFKDLDYTKPESISTLIDYYKSSCK